MNLKDKLEPLLLKVQKPARYIGGELHSVVKDPAIIYDRWLDMDAFVRAQHITSPKILEAHYNRGAAYIEMLDEQFDVNDPAVAAGIGHMVHRINYQIVADSQITPQHYKDALHRHASLFSRVKHRLGKKMGK